MSQKHSAAVKVNLNKDNSRTVLRHFNERKQKESLREIVQRRRITTLFQPIVDLATGRVFSYRALSRVTGASVFSGPQELPRQRMKPAAAPGSLDRERLLCTICIFNKNSIKISASWAAKP